MFKWLFKNKKSEKNGNSKTPSQEEVCFHKLGIDIQTVLLSDPIKDKQLAEFVSVFFAKKYSVTTKAKEAIMTEGYQVWVYRIDLNLINKYYQEERKGYVFKISELDDDTPEVDIYTVITNATIGEYLNFSMEVEKARTTAFKLMCEDDYYEFYRYYGGCLIRLDKKTKRVMFVGKYVHIDFCATLENYLFIYETRGIIGDRKIYACNLDGTCATPLNCLSNEKVSIAGHSQSIDKVVSMEVVDGSLVVTVCRRSQQGTYDYKFYISCLNNELIIRK